MPSVNVTVPMDADLKNKNVPYQETLEALAEVKRMKEDPHYGKRYKDVDSMMKELANEKNHD